MPKLLLTGLCGLGLALSATLPVQAKHHTSEPNLAYTETQLKEDLEKGCGGPSPIPYERCVQNTVQKCTAALRLMREYDRKEVKIIQQYRKCIQDKS